MQENSRFRLRRALIATWFVVVAGGTLAAWAWRAGDEPLGRQALNPQGWAAAYERAYGHLEGVPQPEITRLALALDVFAEEARLRSRGDVVVRNDTLVRVPELLLTAPGRAGEVAFRVPGNVVPTDESLPLRRYRLERPLEPGETLRIRFALDVEMDVANATHFDATHFLPHIGYDPGLEIRDARTRRRYGLRPRPEPRRTARSLEYFHAVVSTSAATATAPGTLQRRWREDGRAFFEYTASAGGVPMTISVRPP